MAEADGSVSEEECLSPTACTREAVLKFSANQTTAKTPHHHDQRSDPPNHVVETINRSKGVVLSRERVL